MLSDWITQRWVQAAGRHVAIADHPWLDGPVGDPGVIGSEFFQRLAERSGCRVIADDDVRGLLPRLADLDGPTCRTSECPAAVTEFYEQTSRFDLDAWSEWCGAFKPFGVALAAIFSRRLQQLNMPLSPLDMSHGLKSAVLHVIDAAGAVRYVAWIREVVGTGRVLYASSYSICTVPGHESPCVKVVFPLPNGNATVIMRATTGSDGTFVLRSSGQRFGDPGFYFFVRSTPGHGWVRYVKTMRETITVFVDPVHELRAMHEFTIWRLVFLRLNYRMRRRERLA